MQKLKLKGELGQGLISIFKLTINFSSF